MGAIKDVVDLLTQLIDSAKDRKFAAELFNIQSMIGDIQSEQADLHEKNIELMTENAELKKSIASLQQEITNAQTPQSPSTDKLSAEEVKILLLLNPSKSLTADQVAQDTELDLTRAEYWLEELPQKDLIYTQMSISFPDEHSLLHGGREYLIKNKLI